LETPFVLGRPGRGFHVTTNPHNTTPLAAVAPNSSARPEASGAACDQESVAMKEIAMAIAADH
jgi:hypothetical protein